VTLLTDIDHLVMSKFVSGLSTYRLAIRGVTVREQFVIWARGKWSSSAAARTDLLFYKASISQKIELSLAKIGWAAGCDKNFAPKSDQDMKI